MLKSNWYFYAKNTKMSESLIIKEEILFKSSVEKIWDLLINPEMTKQYMYGCELISDWKIGSPVHWNGRTENGEEMTYVTGKVIEYIEFEKVISTTFDPHSGQEDIPANHIHLTYELKKIEEGTLLTITQGDFAGAEDATKKYEESKAGWREVVVPAMKKILGE